MKYLFFCLFFMCTSYSYTQIGIGGTFTNDLYQRYTNLDDGSSGSAVLNFGVGPKIWLGMEKVSLSLEGTANLGLFGLDIGNYKGLGMAAIPVVARLNFQGLTCLDKEGKMGFTIGGGLQWNRTELYGITDDFAMSGGERNWFRTFVAEVGYGFGMSGFAGYGLIRYGWDPDSNANNFSIGLQYDLNIPKLKKITDPASEL